MARRTPHFVTFAIAALVAAPASAQESPPSSNAIPRGPGGAILKPAAPEPPPAGKRTPPRPLNYTDPEYPAEALKTGEKAEVILLLDVDAQGTLLKAVVQKSGGPAFDEAALAAVKKLRFAPAREADGTPFAARFPYRYTFAPKEAPPPPPDEPGPAAAQSVENLGGVVLASGADVPIAGATVTLGTLGQTTTTDEKGAFHFRDVPPGKYTVSVSAAGLEPLVADETVTAGEATIVKYRLKVKGGAIEVTVKGERPPREVTKRTLEQREISRIPGTNGDALRSLQSLPGVARPPGVLGVLLVRGSGPQDTQTFIDGTAVPLIYHFGGLSSVVPTELLDKIDFYPGNFSTQYGRVMGGIVDVGLRAPKDEYHGLAQMDLIDVRAMFEGPIPFAKKWKFLAAGRRSYVDAWLGPVLKAAGAGVTQAPVYYDYQFILQTKPTPESDFRVAFFGSDDNLKVLLDKPAAGEPALSGNVGLHTAFMRLQARYSNDFENGDRLNALLALGRDNVDFGIGSLYFLLDFKTLSGRVEYSKKLGKGVVLNSGVDVLAGTYDVHVRLPAPPQAGQPSNGPFSTRTPTETQLTGGALLPAGYLELELQPHPRLRVVPGVRLDYFNLTGAVDFSPRVNARFDVKPEFPKTTLKSGVGIFHQAPQFQEVTKPFGNPDLKSNRAIQYSAGVEQEITQRLNASVEGFYKQLDSLVVSSPSPSGASVQYTNSGTGYVVGSEVLIKYKPKDDDPFFGWLAYTLSRSVRNDGLGQPDRLVNFDQTHILTVLGSYRLGGGWEFGARFRLISGNLVTPNVCDISSGDCNPFRTNALYNAASGVYTPIPLSGPASERLPLFHQLDVRIDKHWKFKSWKLSAYLDVQNVYNHANVEAINYNFNYTGRQWVSGLPILPSIGLRGEF